MKNINKIQIQPQNGEVIENEVIGIETKNVFIYFGFNPFSLIKNNVLILIILVAIVFSSCESINKRIDGYGDYTSQEFRINDVNSLSVSSYADVYISKGETSLRIEGQSNVLRVLNVSDDHNRLEIGKDNKFGRIKPLKIFLSTPHMESIEIAGKVDVSVSGIYQSSSFEIDISGKGSLKMAVETEELITNLSGEIELALSGNAVSHSIYVSGNCLVESLNMLTSETEIIASGSSELEIYADEKLFVEISGSTNIYYKGNPEIQQKISGSGRIEAVR